MSFARHVVCTLRSPGPLETELPQHVTCVALNFRGRAPWAAIRLARLFAQQQPHLVHARNWNTWPDSAMATLLLGAHAPTLVFGFHGVESDAGFEPSRRRLARWLGLNHHHFTSVSRCGMDLLEAQLGISPSRIRLLANGVDTRRFQPSETETLPVGRPVVITSVGSLIPIKGHLDLIEAVKLVAQASGSFVLRIVGEGPLRNRIEQEARTLPSNIRLELLGNRSDIPDILRNTDVFVLASVQEQMSIALLEAMACGVPVVATDVGDNAAVVQDGRSGWVVPRRDPQALADAITRLVKDAGLRQETGKRARLRVEQKYDLDSMADRYADYYRALLADRASRAIGRIQVGDSRGIPA